MKFSNSTKITFFLSLCLILCVGCRTRREYPVKEGVAYKVIKVLDGDTYDILLPDTTQARIRMLGIDAPEKAQDFSKKSTQYLKSLIAGQYVTLTDIDMEQYGRYLAFTHLSDGREAGEEMLKAGYAWHFKKYNQDKKLAALEDSAKANQVGLWGDKHPVEPWIWRCMQKKGYKFVETKQLKIEGKLPDLKAAQEMPKKEKTAE